MKAEIDKTELFITTFENTEINRILDSKTIENWEGFTGYELSYGSKRLHIFIDYGSGAIETYIQTEKPEKRKAGETTMLYKAAKRLIEEFVQSGERALEYSFVTRNPRMHEWAEKTGREIFDWDEEYDTKEDGETAYAYVKMFSPPEEEKIAA